MKISGGTYRRNVLRDGEAALLADGLAASSVAEAIEATAEQLRDGLDSRTHTETIAITDDLHASYNEEEEEVRSRRGQKRMHKLLGIEKKKMSTPNHHEPNRVLVSAHAKRRIALWVTYGAFCSWRNKRNEE